MKYRVIDAIPIIQFSGLYGRQPGFTQQVGFNFFLSISWDFLQRRWLNSFGKRRWSCAKKWDRNSDKDFVKCFVSHFLPFFKFSFIPAWYYQVLDTLKFLEPGLTVKTFSYIRLHPSLSSLYSFPNGPSSRKWTNQMRFSNSHPCLTVTCVLVH